MAATGTVPRHHKRERFTLRVRLLNEPCLWCWEILDAAAHRTVDSSWSSSWMAWETPEEARNAGNIRLAEMVERLRANQERFATLESEVDVEEEEEETASA